MCAAKTLGFEFLRFEKFRFAAKSSISRQWLLLDGIEDSLCCKDAVLEGPILDLHAIQQHNNLAQGIFQVPYTISITI